jgi:hypothetical protein
MVSIYVSDIRANRTSGGMSVIVSLEGCTITPWAEVGV